MTDNTLTENDDEELIPVDTPPEEDKEPEQQADDEDEEDERLAQSEDESEADITSRGTNTERAEKRRKRRETLRKARDADRMRIEMLQRQNAELLQRMAALEGKATQSTVQSLEQRIAATRAEIAQAEHVIAKATEAGNGEDVVAAMRLRDQAMAQAQQLEYAKQQAAQPRAPQVDPNVVNYAKQWMEANPWYDPQGRDRDSALTKAIDAELAREGYDPASRDYWEELTARVADAFGEGGDTAPTGSARPRRKAPPTGNTREHAPASTKREIYVTPERKQAMIEAGIWDDPVRRNQMLKAYQAYDRSGSAG